MSSPSPSTLTAKGFASSAAWLLAAMPAAAQPGEEARIAITGTIAAQCVTEPQRVLVANDVVIVTMFARCNRPGRFVVSLNLNARPLWAGSGASHRGEVRTLDSGRAEFEIRPGPAREERFEVRGASPGALRQLADAVQVSITLD